MRLSVIVINYNTRELLSGCLKSLQKDPAHGDWQIIVVDNGSEDGSAMMVRQEFPEVTLLALDENVGFAKANNRAAEVAQGRYLAFLNADTVVPAGVLGWLCDFLDEQADAAIAGPRMLGTDGELQYTARTFPGPLNTFLEYFFLDRLFSSLPFFGRPRLTCIDHTERHRVDYVSGACLIIAREYFEKAGRWCEHYFFYAEDADLCAQVKKIGGQTYYCGGRTITHFGGASARQLATATTIEAHRSVFLFVRRQRGAVAMMLQRLITFVGALGRTVATAVATPFAALFGDGRRFAARTCLYCRVIRLCFSPNPYPTGRFIDTAP
ncbi:MAG: glycosyltransferase family 2 protein [Armatimonadota bacterium]